MGIFDGLKANKAYKLQQKGQTEEAIRLYEELFEQGMNDPRYNLAYAMLIIRKGEYQKAKDFLVKHQKAPGMTQEQRTTLLVDYAACCFRLGDLDKGVRVLEQQSRKVESGLLYQTLGYLYVEKYDLTRTPNFTAPRDKAKSVSEPAETEGNDTEAERQSPSETEGITETGAVSTTEAEENTTALVTEEKTDQAEGSSPAPTPEEEWEAGVRKAEEYLHKALEYDDEDSICLDNMGQFVYRVQGDRAGAREWFEKALAIKDSQIDTLVFLSRYDEEDGNIEGALEKLEKAAEGRFSPLNYCTREQVNGEISRLKGE